MSEISTSGTLSRQGSMAVDQDTQESSSVIMEAATVTGPKRKRNWMVENKWVTVKKLPDGRKEFRCQWESVTGKICNHPTTSDKKGSTSNMVSHMRNKHSITASSPAKGESPVSRGIGSLDPFLTPQAPIVMFTKKIFYQTIIDDLIASRAPYTAVERPTLQRLLYIAHSAPSLQDLKLPSDTTIKRHMSDYYNELKLQVKEKLQLVPCLAYTADGWTTSNMKHSFLGVTAHWIDEEWSFRSLAIGFEPLKGSHTGTNLAATMVTLLEEFELDNKPFFLTTDNASNMVTMAKELEASLGSEVFSAENNHISCIGHVINLVVQTAIVAGLKAQAPENTDSSEDNDITEAECK